MTVKSNDMLEAIIQELEDVGATDTIENASRHYCIRYEYQGQKGQVFSSRGLYQRNRSVKNVRAQVRRDLRSMGAYAASEPEASSEDVTVTQETGDLIMQMTTITTDNLVVLGDGVPRMRDIDIGSALGFTRTSNIRQLIESNMAELRTYGEISSSELVSGERGGRPSRSYMLNEEQALLIAMFSRTPRAADVRRQLITAFTEYAERSEPKLEAPKSEVRAIEPEIMMNGQAIDAIATRLAGLIGTGAPVQPQTMSMDGLLTRDEFQSNLRKLVEWHIAHDEQQERKLLAAPKSESDTINLIGHRLSLIEDTQRSLMEMLKDTASRPQTAGPSMPDQAHFQEIDPNPVSLQAEGDRTKTSKSEETYGAEIDGKIYFCIKDIYEMLGVDFKTTRRRQSVSARVRHSLEAFNRDGRAERVWAKHPMTSVPANYWPEDFVVDWCEKQGRKILRPYLSR